MGWFLPLALTGATFGDDLGVTFLAGTFFLGSSSSDKSESSSLYCFLAFPTGFFWGAILGEVFGEDFLVVFGFGYSSSDSDSELYFLATLAGFPLAGWTGDFPLAFLAGFYSSLSL